MNCQSLKNYQKSYNSFISQISLCREIYQTKININNKWNYMSFNIIPSDRQSISSQHTSVNTILKKLLKSSIYYHTNVQSITKSCLGRIIYYIQYPLNTYTNLYLTLLRYSNSKIFDMFILMVGFMQLFSNLNPRNYLQQLFLYQYILYKMKLANTFILHVLYLSPQYQLVTKKYLNCQQQQYKQQYQYAKSKNV
eukprot:TRINITY_DN3233_c0_g2_i2.p1 TRINITY_DN3233_c0_g2~~TRINITY_DN3233_c0_g2_i2.p1  ORF type:complete len:207 (+),score=-20.25 TRINITY_DN3233_c0_g2_i2:38-622(+)